MERLTVFDKHTGEALGELTVADAAAVAAATRRARDAFPAWSATPAHRRATILRAASESLTAHADELARLIARESGKALKYASAEVARAAETFGFAADEARRIHGETVPMDASAAGEGRLGFWLRMPIGVVAAITPFNFPLNLVAHKVAPALAAGNAVVLKPAERTPLTAVRLAALLAECGLPQGALELVHGDGPTTGEALCSDPVPAMVSFTGSPAVGRRILAIAGLKRVTLELGNNSATIVEPDADIAKAVPRCVMSAFANAGQVCLSLQRLYVHERIAEAFTERFLATTSALTVGNPLDPGCDVGPMISVAAAERAEAWVDEALARGARRLGGGRREGALFWPTVLTDVQPAMKVMCQEVFAPVVSIVRYARFEDALDQAADSEYGLQAGIYTRDLDKALLAARRLDVGGVMINDTSIFRADHMPYGGNRGSGLGREGVRFAVEEMTSLRMVVIAPS
ncbi:MAG: aldehyde dehydrogenase family protein [Vicinamibacteria bacterium]|nr:aldehyde dehydrogenase family protein [Vicinamibacteria bacterium]